MYEFNKYFSGSYKYQLPFAKDQSLAKADLTSTDYSREHLDLLRLKPLKIKSFKERYNKDTSYAAISEDKMIMVSIINNKTEICAEVFNINYPY